MGFIAELPSGTLICRHGVCCSGRGCGCVITGMAAPRRVDRFARVVERQRALLDSWSPGVPGDPFTPHDTTRRFFHSILLVFFSLSPIQTRRRQQEELPILDLFHYRRFLNNFCHAYGFFWKLHTFNITTYISNLILPKNVEFTISAL